MTDVITDTTKRGGNLVIPTFAVEQAQEIMYHLANLVYADHIPDLPIFLDRPMVVDVTDVFRLFGEYMDEDTYRLFNSG